MDLGDNGKHLKKTYTHQINSEFLSKGVYVISLMSNDERKVSKFIVE